MFGARQARLRQAVLDQDEAAVVRLVRRRGIDQRDDMGRTVLYLAAARESIEIVRLLLEVGANPNISTSFGETPYFAALSGAFANAAVPALLREHGAVALGMVDVDKTDQGGRTPLHYASRVDLLAELLTCQASVHARDLSGATPLHFAAGRGNVQVVQMLLDAGAEVDAVDDRGDTPLLTATQRSPEAAQIIGLLRQHGADPFHANDRGTHAVNLAARPSIGGNSEQCRVALADLFDDPRAV